MRQLIARAEEAAGLPLDPDRFLVVGTARWKRAFFLYDGRNGVPACVVKVPANARALLQCETEHRELTRFEGLEIPGVRAPRALARFVWNDSHCFVQEALHSRQWLGRLPLWVPLPRRSDLRRAAVALSDMYHATRDVDPIPGRSYARCYQHGDFWPGNLGRIGDGLALYDFEYAKPRGLPLHDLVHFVLYYGVALRNVGRGGAGLVRGSYDRSQDQRVFAPTAADVERLFVKPGRSRSPVLAAVGGYLEATGMAPADGAELLLSYVEDDRGITGLDPGWESAIV